MHFSPSSRAFSWSWIISWACERLDQSSFIVGRILMASLRYWIARPMSIPPMCCVASSLSFRALRSSSRSAGVMAALRSASAYLPRHARDI